MSEENVELAKGLIRDFNRRDLAAVTEADPEVEWHAAIEQALEGGESTYRGHDGVRRAWEEYHRTAWGGFTSQAEEIRDLGESVLLLGHLEVSGRTAGIELGQEFAQLITFRDGKILRAEDFLSHADALEAAGLSE
jgi:ketosteroid isomerase-like protein